MDKIQEILIERRKEKNKIECKKYYLVHKEELIKRGCEKVKCDKCDKLITRNRLQKHQETKNCLKRSIIKAEILPHV